MSIPFPHARIAVVGPGAVGGYYGGSLALGGNEVHFLVRSGADALNRSGLHIHSNERGHFHVTNIHWSEHPEDIGPCDLVIVALKATANRILPEVLPPLLGPHTAILTLQNGLGNDTLLAEHFGAERVMGGLCFVCINRDSPGVVRHMAEGSINMGAFGRAPGAREQAMCDEWVRCGVTCLLTPDLRATQWRKLVWNIPFNGLTIAIGGHPVDRIMRNPALRELATEIMREVIHTSELLGMPLPEGLVDDQLRRTDAVGDYYPSSLIDWKAGRPVELNAIWGEPLRQARSAGARMPSVECLYAILSALDHEAAL